MKPFCWLIVLAIPLGASSPPSLSEPKHPPSPAPPAIHILSEMTLPPADEWARDVRWASDKSVYLALSVDGTIEFSLDPQGQAKEMIPGRASLGGFWSAQRVAASSKYLATAGPALVVTWRRLDNPTRVEVPFDTIQAIDLRENQLAIVGARRDEKGGYGKDGAIAWTGSLDKKLGDLRPLLYDVRGPGVPTMSRCGSASMGAVRFLPDGSLVVIPGIQPGVSLYDSSGKLVRTWETSSLGIDADCGVLTEQQGYYFASHYFERQVWLNQRHMVDSVLPFPEGPGLVVRRVEQGRTRWDLKLLRLDGTVQTFPIPIEGSNEFFNLEGDLRAGKIIFLLHEPVFKGSGKTHPTPPRLMVATSPQGLAN